MCDSINRDYIGSIVRYVSGDFEIKEIENLTIIGRAESLVEYLKSKITGKNKKYILLTLEEIDGQQR